MTKEEIKNRIQEAIRQNQVINSQHIQIPLILNSYQLSNVLRAIRLSENSGDWYHEVLGMIDFQLGAYNLTLDEYYNPEINSKYVKPFISDANLPYPENFTLINGKKPTVS